MRTPSRGLKTGCGDATNRDGAGSPSQMTSCQNPHMTDNTTIGFSTDGPFFSMVGTFLLATVGLGPLYDPDSPLDLSKDAAAWYQGQVEPLFLIDLDQVRQVTHHIASDRAVQELCCMLIISTHAVAAVRAPHPAFTGL
jgi:hypothetical protein